MEEDCFVEKHMNCWMPGFTPDDDNWTAFHSSPVSRFLSIAQYGLWDSVAAQGGRVCKEGSGVYSAPSVWLDRYYILEQSETTTTGRKHVLTYEMLLRKAATKRKRKHGKKGKVYQYITPTQSVIPVLLYYMVYDNLKL